MRLSRFIAGALGLFLIVYFAGGTIGNAVADRFFWQTAMIPVAGVLLGFFLVSYAAWGNQPAARAILSRSLITGLAAALLGAMPGMLILGVFFGGVAPPAYTAVVVIPSLFVIGAVVGGVRAHVQRRRDASLSAAQ